MDDVGPSSEDAAYPRGLSAAAFSRLILASIVDHAIVTLDAEGRVSSWNEGAERILGWSEDEIVGRPADLFFTPEDVAAGRPEAEMREALRDGHAEDERWYRRRDGTLFWASGLMMPLTPPGAGAADGVVGFLKVLRDQTEKHLSDRRAADLESRAALALRSFAMIGVWDYDMLKNVVIADEVCAALHGVDPGAASRGTPAAIFYEGIDPRDRDRVEAAVAACAERGAGLDEEYRLAAPAPRPRWVQVRGAVQRDGSGRLARMTGIGIDVTEQKERLERQTALLEFGDRLRDLTDPDEIAFAASELVGRTLGATRAGIGDLHPDEDAITIRPDWTDGEAASIAGTLRYSTFGGFAEPLRRGETVVIADARGDDRVPDPGPLEAIDARSLVNMPLRERGRLRAVLFVNDRQPRDWTEEELGFLRAMFDRTFAAIERARAEAERAVLAAELAHRMKNMLAIAQIIAVQSLRHAATVEEARLAVTSRLSALSQAQDLLTRSNHAGADIRAVVEGTLEPHTPAPDRISIEGPELHLDPQQVLGLSLALHELGTNAAKHGALTAEGGRVAIRWTHGPGGAFALRWTESGGPPTRPPDTRGFGSTILDRVAGSYFSGSSEVAFPETGVTFAIDGVVA